MPTVPLHPAVVHVPLGLAMVLPFVAIGLIWAIWRKWLPHGAWGIALGLQVLLAATGFVALQSGERDEEVVERVVPEAAIEAHEERGELFVWWNVGVLAFVLLPLVLRRAGSTSRLRLEALALLGMLGASFLAYRTGAAGGELVFVHGAAQAHIQRGAAPAQLPATTGGEHEESEAHED